MSSINYYIANSHGKLSSLIPKIEKAVKQSIPILEDKLKADKLDIIFLYAPQWVIPEMGIGANSPGSYQINVTFDPSFRDIKQNDIYLSILHEAHHCMRWRKPGYGTTLGDALIAEGLATLFEEEISGKPPIYSQVKIKKEEIKKAKEIIKSDEYDHSEWFFGTKKIQRWFGYTYGYQICKEYSEKSGKKSYQLVHIKTKEIIN